MSKKLSLKLFSAVILAMLVATVQMFAQSTVSGGISGTVTDPQGALVPNATVTATNIGTNASTTVNTSDDGGYRITNLNPGTYRLDVAGSSGFAPARAENIIVEVGRFTPIDVKLTLGSATAVVDVPSEAPVINTEDASNSTNVNQTSISELPINGRRASDFVRLTPGVNPEGDFGLNSFRGLSALLNNNTLDGTDNNNTFFSEERGRTRIQYSVSQAAVREFQVNTSNYSAEYGRAAGGVINTVTKSGTNDFHGELFFFDRDNKWGARNPSALLPGNIPIKPKDTRYQFGGAAGGRIIKDKLFFFFTYDQQKRNFPGVATTSTATALDPITVAAPTGTRVCSAPAAGQTVTTVPGEILFCRGLTQTQVNNQLAFLKGLTGEVPRRQDQRIIFPKIDWNINARNTGAFSYNRVRTTGINAFQTPAIVFVGRGGFGNDYVDIDTFNARVTSTLTSNLVNEARFQYGREFARSVLGALTPAEQALAGTATTTINGQLPSISFTNGLQFGVSNNFQRRKFPLERTIQFADTMNYVAGNHGLKFGMDVKFSRDDVDNLRTEAGAYSYNNVVDLISDLQIPSGKRYNNYQQGFGLAAYTIKTPDYALFFQDNWRVTPRITLNLGLRYDYQGFGKPQFPNTSSATLLATQSRYTQGAADAIIAQTRTFPKDKDNFGPRFGFAWDLTGDGKTSLRAGYGIYYGRIPNTFLASPTVNTGAPGSQLTTGSIRPTDTLTGAGGVVIPTPTLANTLTAVPTRTLAIVVMSPTLENPTIHEGDVIFERQIASNMAVSVSYLFNFGRKIPRFADLNLNYPLTTRTYTISGGPMNGQTVTTPFFTGARPITNFGSIIEVESNAHSTYHGLVLQANRRMSNGLQFQASYTFAHAEDEGQQLGTFAPGFPTISNPFDPLVDRGRSDLDIRHKFVASAVWQFGHTFGWDKDGLGRAVFRDFQISPIVNISSGRPVTGFISASPTGGTSSGLLGSGGPQRTFFLPRGADSRPTTWLVDMRVSKRFHFREGMSLELLAEGFNIFNHSNFTGIRDQIYTLTTATNTLVYDTTYLTPTTINNTINFTPRQVQLGARFHF